MTAVCWLQLPHAGVDGSNLVATAMVQIQAKAFPMTITEAQLCFSRTNRDILSHVFMRDY